MCMMKFELSKVEGCGGLGGSRLTWGDKEVTMQYLELKGGDRGACKLLGDVIEVLGCLLEVLDGYYIDENYGLLYPAWSASAYAVRDIPVSFEYQKPMLMVPL
ncbi:hypothetical protein Tco_1411640, partial [Tanacetum coccineum]